MPRKNPFRGIVDSSVFSNAALVNLDSEGKSWSVFADPHCQHTASVFVSLLLPSDFPRYRAQLAPAVTRPRC